MIGRHENMCHTEHVPNGTGRHENMCHTEHVPNGTGCHEKKNMLIVTCLTRTIFPVAIGCNGQRPMRGLLGL